MDLLESFHLGYHTGISFSIFSKESNEELGSGGRYEIEADTTESAVGFTLNISEIASICNIENGEQKVYLAYGTDKSDRKKLQEEGYITVNALENNDNPESEAKTLGCSLLFKNGKLTAVSLDN